MVGLERERGAGCHAFFLWKDWRVWRGVEGGGGLLSIFGCKYRLICNEVSRSMWVTGFNGILCSKWFRSQRQIINWLTSLAEFTILLQLTNVSPCCFCCIVTMKNALKQFLDFPIIWSWRQFNFYHNYEVERSSQGWQLFILKRKNMMLLLLIYLFLSHYRL